MNDQLGKRMKEQYEDRTRFYLPRRTYTIIRLDGKAFHTYTKNLEKPFDLKFMEAMNNATFNLANEMQNFKLAYVQSDEVSFLMTDFSEITTEAWFNGNLQKISSISASLMTANFMTERMKNGDSRIACFDARTFIIPDKQEVVNYFIWRQKDAIRNSLQLLAQSLYSHKELFRKKQSDLHDMCFMKGHNWNNLSTNIKQGTIIWRKNDVNILEGAFNFVTEMKQLYSYIPKILEV